MFVEKEFVKIASELHGQKHYEKKDNGLHNSPQKAKPAPALWPESPQGRASLIGNILL
jgi:hypothetical protein